MARAVRTRRRVGSPPPDAACRLEPPAGGAIVRMYRIGHGDCFLIAFAGADPDRPAHVLIDCGYKPGSPGKLATPTTVKEIGQDIAAVTGGFVDVAIITHEHQDHVNGFTATAFPNLRVGEVWFAWTENPDDDVANQLRRKFKDRLLELVDAHAHLLSLSMADPAADLAVYLEAELGEAADTFNGRSHRAAAGRDPASSRNKMAMKFLRACAPGDPEYLYPHGAPRPITGAKSARAFVLGPPRDINKIDDLNPRGDEEFKLAAAGGLSVPSERSATRSPFSRRHVIPLEDALADPDFGPFFAGHYGSDAAPVGDVADGENVPDDSSWRRLPTNDAMDAGEMALAMSNATNNASLVLAFELAKGGKVLLFAADAQAGNWRSWSEGTFDDGGIDVTARDLLERTVVYKVGHHGSHNATLKGKSSSQRACLAWMAKGQYGAEFTALITAVEEWAHQKPKPDWNHPLPAIKQALIKKCAGRVLQTDTPIPQAPPSNGAAAGWRQFRSRVTETALYFDIRIDP